MKFGRTIEDLIVELDRQNNVKRDFLAPMRSIMMENTYDGQQLRMQGNGFAQMMRINPICHEQIATSLKIPMGYYNRMAEQEPELLVHNVNRWFQHGDNPESTRMIRTLDGTARAFLSDKYKRIDNWDIAQAVLPILYDVPGIKMESCQVTDERLYLKAVTPKLTADIRVGDAVQAGIMITNSEVGRGMVKVQPLLYRLVCTNGMVANDSKVSQRHRHIGKRLEATDDYGVYSDDTLQLEAAALIGKLRDSVKATFDEERFASLTGKMKAAAEVPIGTKNVPGFIELAATQFGIEKGKESNLVMEAFITDHDYSLYGLANAVTKAAQSVESYDRSTEMEEIGYEILTSPVKSLLSLVKRAEEAVAA